MRSAPRVLDRRFGLLAFGLLACVIAAVPTKAQNNLTGAFEGKVFDSTNPSTPIVGATVQFKYQVNGVQRARHTDESGRFYEGNLAPGDYTITVTANGYKTKELVRTIFATKTNEVRPVPVPLEPEAPSTPTVVQPASPSASPPPAMTQPASNPAPQALAEDRERQAIDINTTNAQRGGVFQDKETSTLPLGGATLVRSFDELALLLPGVATPPQTQGSVAGPGVGPGVGSAGQFSVNGLRSRANNFTVDGSDNNDEDIGVRRQGFLSLVPQTIESIKEYQVISLLAPAQYGRNIGAQVNAVSKSGTQSVHGAVYGFFNSSQLNSRNFFDTTNGNTSSALRAGNNQAVLLNGNPITVRNQSGGEDSFTLGHFGVVVGGPVVPERMFYFFSLERQVLNATKEESFAVPTVDQRGILGSGATGLFLTPFANRANTVTAGSQTRASPSSFSGDAIFSLFPFPNNPTGTYGANTFTQVLPASGRGLVLSGKVDNNFKLWSKPQTFTARYNFTNDRRDIPATGGAIFSSLRPRVRTQNFSTFLNSELTGTTSTRPVFNQLRLSYGRTRLNFEELRDPSLLPSTGFREQTFGSFGLLNAPFLRNATLPSAVGVANSGPVTYLSGAAAVGRDTVEQALGGPVGQILIAGFSPVGMDVFNFPQKRVNNTYQVADTLTWRRGDHNLSFGTDIRRTELNSDLPRNARPLITINGAPQLTFDSTTNTFATTNRFIRPIDLAAGGAASGFSQTVVLPGNDSRIDLRYYQWNFFGQDEWRIRRNLSLSYGLRYEYNTPPRDVSGKIEKTFSAPELSVVPGLSNFIDGRTRIFDPDRNNVGPRLGVAYSPNFGSEHLTVIRAGYGLYFDQIPGAVVSQSRNVFPTFLTFNTPGGTVNFDFANNPAAFPYGVFTVLDPVGQIIPGHFHVQPGTLNVLANPEGFTTLRDLLLHHISVANALASGGGALPPASGLGATLPTRRLAIPMAHQYAVMVEQKLSQDMVLSLAYVGTQGRNLLRFNSPNLGQDSILVPLASEVFGGASPRPVLFGLALPPGFRVASGRLSGGRPVATVGTINQFETTAQSSYNAAQFQLRGRFRNSLQYQVSYTLSRSTDDVSDVFDLAGAAALPQNSITLAGESGPANFDARHRLSYNFIYDLPDFDNHGRAFRFFFKALQVAGTGGFESGQPFTVNSIFDVNLDGNLTDRLNTTAGINVTGDRRQPLQLTVDPTTLLARIGQDGSVGRNTFRAGSVLELDLSLIKNFKFSEQRLLALRMDIFNFINRANFGIPVRFLEAPGFGQATSTVTPGRRLQVALKFTF
jgi:hypothetical protein